MSGVGVVRALVEDVDEDVKDQRRAKGRSRGGVRGYSVRKVHMSDSERQSVCGCWGMICAQFEICERRIVCGIERERMAGRHRY
jgi:hypothetical protein